ncbi:MAG: hypothetical protein V2I33_04635 [Kangiellaceae bacterium]|jgi:TPR repeat protein|nr:hypothetical protein [Kangiellaceae bacterium]
MKLLTTVLFTLCCTAFAQGEVDISSYTPNDIPKLKDQGKLKEAFYAEKFFAEQGDDRSQYNTGVNYYKGVKGVIKPDTQIALAWILLSLKESNEHRRTIAARDLKKMLNQDEINKATAQADVWYKQYGTRKRINKYSAGSDFYNPKKQCLKTGTRVKGKCPIMPTITIE